MQRMRMIVLILLVASGVAFTGFRYYEYRNTDKTIPQLVIATEELELSTTDSSDMLLKGVTAFDEKDGDLTQKIYVEDISNLMPGDRRQVTYVVVDSDYHVVKKTRYIRYTDYHEPRFRLDRPLQFTVNRNTDICTYVGVEDCLEGDISDRVKQSSSQTLGENAGDFQVKLQVSNGAGDVVSLPVTVSFYENGVLGSARRPDIELAKYLYYIKKGKNFEAERFPRKVIIGEKEYSISKQISSEQDAFSGAEDATENVIAMERLQIQDQVDTSVPGVYEVLYELKLPDKEKTEVRLIVVVWS